MASKLSVIWQQLPSVREDKVLLTLKALNFWKFTSYCSLKPLWSGMGEVVPARTSPTLHPSSPPTVHQLSRLTLYELSLLTQWCETWTQEKITMRNCKSLIFRGYYILQFSPWTLVRWNLISWILRLLHCYNARPKRLRGIQFRGNSAFAKFAKYIPRKI